MRIVLNTFGSFGDIHPYLAIALELQSRGHVPVIATSQGLLAGVPTLIVPFAFDQSDNAEHVRRLDTSRTVYRDKYRAPRVAKELHELLTRPEYAQNAREVSKKLKQENGAGRAADLIERVLDQTPDARKELVYAAGD